MINLIFTMNGPRLTDEQAGQFSAFAQWVVLNERNGRLLVDGIGKAEDVAGVMAMLGQLGRAPAAIGAWHQDGTPVEGYALDTSAWLAVAPDVPDPTDQESLAFVRPTAFTEIHQWGGWAPKLTQE